MGMTQEKVKFAIVMAFHATPKHVGAECLARLCQKMLRFGATHNRLAVEQCNREWTAQDETKRARVRKQIVILAKQMGCTSVLFHNDPRGCTVKLVVPDGYTNDWGREGICVPTA